MSEDIKQRWSSRKLTVAVSFQCVWIAGAGVLIYHMPEQLDAVLNAFTWLTGITIGGYFGGNVGEHFSKRR